MPNSLTIKVFVELLSSFHPSYTVQPPSGGNVGIFSSSLAWYPQCRLQPQFLLLAQFAYFRSKRRESRQDLSDHLNAALWEKDFWSLIVGFDIGS